jgi:TusA-related sulfurtransferase
MKNKQKERNNWKGSRSKSKKVDHFLDLRGMIIPLTLLKITQALRNIKDGQTMDIVGTDPDTRRNFLTILGTSPCEVLWVRDEKDLYSIRLRKGRGEEV